MNFTLRALNVCDPQFLSGELDHIKETFGNLCYPVWFVNWAMSRAKGRFYQLTDSNNRYIERKFLVLPYHPSLEQFDSVFNDESGINLVFKYNNTIARKVIHNKEKTGDARNVGVYEIPCKNCDRKYFGETGRSIEVRMSEHKRDYDQAKMSNVLAKHSWDENHRIDWMNAKLICKENEVGKRRVIEGACINIGKSMNGNKSFTSECKLLNTEICKTYTKGIIFNTNETIIETAENEHIGNDRERIIISSSGPSTALPLSSLSSQMLQIDDVSREHGTYADDMERRNDGTTVPRRSSRIAARSHNTEIT